MRELKKMCDKSGIDLREYANGHFQLVKGYATVNYWPNSRRRSCFLQGKEKEVKRGATEKYAVELCLKAAEEFADGPDKIDGNVKPMMPHMRLKHQA